MLLWKLNNWVDWHNKGSETYRGPISCIKTCHIPSQKNKNSCIKVSHTRACIHCFSVLTHRTKSTHWIEKIIPQKAQFLTELQSLQISCPSSQKKLYSCRIFLYIWSSQSVRLQSLQNILHSKAAFTLSLYTLSQSDTPPSSDLDDLGHSATKNLKNWLEKILKHSSLRFKHARPDPMLHCICLSATMQ